MRAWHDASFFDNYMLTVMTDLLYTVISLGYNTLQRLCHSPVTCDHTSEVISCKSILGKLLFYMYMYCFVKPKVCLVHVHVKKQLPTKTYDYPPQVGWPPFEQWLPPTSGPATPRAVATPHKWAGHPLSSGYPPQVEQWLPPTSRPATPPGWSSGHPLSSGYPPQVGRPPLLDGAVATPHKWAAPPPPGWSSGYPTQVGWAPPLLDGAVATPHKWAGPPPSWMEQSSPVQLWQPHHFELREEEGQDETNSHSNSRFHHDQHALHTYMGSCYYKGMVPVRSYICAHTCT